jgi:hypothetical protein
MPLAGFEPTIPASEKPQTHTLGRVIHESPFALNHLFKDSNSILITFLKSLRLEVVNINQYHSQVTFYIFHE